jgi:hypothetical protein
MPITESAADFLRHRHRADAAPPARNLSGHDQDRRISAPNSRVTDLATATTTCDCAPNSDSAA